MLPLLPSFALPGFSLLSFISVSFPTFSLQLGQLQNEENWLEINGTLCSSEITNFVELRFLLRVNFTS